VSKKNIPARVIVTCDICKRNNDQTDFRKDARLLLQRCAMDMLSDPAAKGDVELDLCDDCEVRIAKAIISTGEAIRAEMDEA